VEASSGFRELDQAAIETARKWRFNPNIRNGTKTEGYVRVPINFNLNQL
jgi:protein TonB